MTLIFLCTPIKKYNSFVPNKVFTFRESCRVSYNNSSYYSWACSSAVFAWKWDVWVIILKRKCLCIKYSKVLAILSYFWLVLRMMRHCTAYGCFIRNNKVGWENLSWYKHHSKYRFCYMARAGTTEHLNMLFFGKICVWRYVSLYYLLEITTFAVDHDPNASLSCTFTWKPLNCRLNCNNCYLKIKLHQLNRAKANPELFNSQCHFFHIWLEHKLVVLEHTVKYFIILVIKRKFFVSYLKLSHSYALHAHVCIYVEQLSYFRAPALWFINLTVITCHIQYAFLSLCQFSHKKMDKTWKHSKSVMFVWYENGHGQPTRCAKH